jgi:hypothetical protein
MPSNFKKMVRARMAETGESWQAAARHVREGEYDLANLLTVTRAAAGIGRCEATLQCYIKEGDVEAVKVAGRWFIPWSEVERLRGLLREGP